MGETQVSKKMIYFLKYVDSLPMKCYASACGVNAMQHSISEYIVVVRFTGASNLITFEDCGTWNSGTIYRVWDIPGMVPIPGRLAI